jgi:X-X-X-Leu-X-X-Gly heptad repeat protein
MGSDDSGRLMNSGINEARSGVSKAQTGVNEVNGGSQATGMFDINSGMDMMTQGVTDMHSSMGMMSAGMMTNCMDGGSSGMMAALQQGMDEMHTGQMMLSGDAGPATEGMGHMRNGISMMNSALDEAQASMSCMGHTNMMSGGM